MNPEIKQRIDQIHKGKVPAGYKKTKSGIVPDNWKEIRFKEMFSRITRRNTINSTNVLTISAQYGLINQEDFFSKSVASSDKSNYFLLQQGEFAYNKSYSANYPYGAIKQLEAYSSGIVSPLYICFSPTEKNICPPFYLHYFEAGKLNREIEAFAQEGARNHGLLNISVDDFFNSILLVPTELEQKKIASILTAQDKLIKLKEKCLSEKQRQKKYLMQQLLTGKKRLPNFHRQWKWKKLADVLTERREKNIKQNLRICSVAVQKGVVDQIEHLGRSYAAADTSNYAVAHYGDLIYTKSPTGDFPYGIIKQSFLPEEVAVSPLYGIFVPNSFELGFFLHTYFESSVNAYNYLLPIIQKGAKNTINIKNETFLSNSLYLPTDPLEQKAIANIFLTINREIDLLHQDIEQEKQKKKSLMQLLLTGIVRVTR